MSLPSEGVKLLKEKLATLRLSPSPSPAREGREAGSGRVAAGVSGRGWGGAREGQAGRAPGRGTSGTGSD